MAIGAKGRGSAKGARVITFTYVISDATGIVTLLLIYDKADASNVKMNVVKAIVEELGFDISKMQTEGVLKPIEMEETENQ